jgi:excisionase family DNA binding protein
VIFDDRFYSVAELAEVTGYHRDSIYRAIEAGMLPAAKPRGKWLIPGPAINAWLDTGRAGTAEPPASGKSIRRRSDNAMRSGSRNPRPSFRELARRRRAA